MKSENITWIHLEDISVGDLPLLGSRVGLIKWDELYTQLRGASLCYSRYDLRIFISAGYY